MDQEYSVEELGDDYHKLKDSKICMADLTEAINGMEGRKKVDEMVGNVIEGSMITVNRHHGIDG
jgi:hypothetical protein